jgi:phosphoglucosamine mutase
MSPVGASDAAGGPAGTTIPAMVRLFGTDGVRGVANAELTPDLALALGRAAGAVLAPGGGAVVVGRDTRLSGPMLEGALVAGLCSAGVDALLAGVVPTPAVAYLATDSRAAAGAVISASHNPVPDNGIKFFSDEGLKIAAAVEEKIEARMEDENPDLPTGEAIGRVETFEDALDRYVDHVVAAVSEPVKGLKVVLDCAHGAASHAGPRAFRALGANVVALHDEPDGARINVACGSTALDAVGSRVVEEGAHFGIGFDGDADRALAVDEKGNVVDGDQIIAMAALRMAEAGQLKDNLVVATVMTNLGFHRALHERGIEVVSAPVGDRFVAEAMAERGAVLGGEQSGHVIFAEHATTGDGILTALKIAELVATASAPLSELADVFHPLPQFLINVRVAHKERLESAEELWDEVRAAEQELGDNGRVLLRASGTEPVVRVMVEAVDRDRADSLARRLAEAVERTLL